MAICIDIVKYREEKDLHIYQVNKIGQISYEFYVALSPENNTIAFYADKDLKNLLKIIDLNNPKETIDVPCIDSMISARVIGQCARALRENNFPKSIGYYA